jgi:hypothetical protein
MNKLDNTSHISILFMSNNVSTTGAPLKRTSLGNAYRIMSALYSNDRLLYSTSDALWQNAIDVCGIGDSD